MIAVGLGLLAGCLLAVVVGAFAAAVVTLTIINWFLRGF